MIKPAELHHHNGVFTIESDPPDLAERRADRVAEHQRREAWIDGWKGDSWILCGCAVAGTCPKANCINHRMAGIRFGGVRFQAEDDTLCGLSRSIAAAGGKPNAFPVRQPFHLAGTFRVYFNRHQAAPLVWCVAVMGFEEGVPVPLLELAVSELSIDAPMTTVYAPKATPDDEDGKPSAWLEVAGVLTVDGRSVRIARVG